MTPFSEIIKIKSLETTITILSSLLLIASILSNITILLISVFLLTILFSFAWPRLLTIEHPISISIIIIFISTAAIILQSFFTQLGTLTYQIYIFVSCFIVCVVDELFISKNKEPMSSLAYSFLGSIIAVSSVGWISLTQLGQLSVKYALFSLIILAICSFISFIEVFLIDKLPYQQFNYIKISILAILTIVSSIIAYFTVGQLSWKLSGVIATIIFMIYVVKMVLLSDIHIKNSVFAKPLFPIMLLGLLVYINLSIFMR
ncbi:MAG: hypothetical protein LBT99_03055 [Bifidobacteriaceae bacterium]|jgi:hypothetical protein|nr:hypothetical protein [Bifidobacteriaceae bacterium]